MMAHPLTLVALLTLFGLHWHLTAGIGARSVESELYEDLFCNYSSILRPVRGEDYFKQIVVNVIFSLTQVEALNENEENLIVHGGMTLTWTDELLQWNVSDYKGATFLVLPAEKIWLPELAATNSVKDVTELAYDKVESRVSISSNGLVTWIPQISWNTACSVDMTFFPYDEQECTVKFGNWMYKALLVNFTVQEDVVQEVIVPNRAWDLKEALAWFEQGYYEGDLYPIINMKLKIKRNPRYFELHVVLPSLLLSFLLMSMFILPVDSGEKISLGVTLTLSYSILLLILSNYTPKSGSMPTISIALLTSIVFAGVGLLCNVCIINIHYHMPDKEVPGWIRRIFIEKLGHCLQMKYREDENHPRVEQYMDKVEDAKPEESLTKDLSDNDRKGLIEYLEFFKSKRLEDDQVEKNKEDWNKVARVLDRIFFFVYLVYFPVYLFGVLSIRWKHM